MRVLQKASVELAQVNLKVGFLNSINSPHIMTKAYVKSHDPSVLPDSDLLVLGFRDTV